MRTALNFCPPSTIENVAVNVPLNAKDDEDLVRGMPSRTPVTSASTAAGGLGIPGRTQTGCVFQDRVPTLPRSAVPSPNNTVTLIVKSFTTTQELDTSHPVVTMGNVTLSENVWQGTYAVRLPDGTVKTGASQTTHFFDSVTLPIVTTDRKSVV